MNITPLEQQIYNIHLKFSRHGSPWQPRKDFSNLTDENLIYLKKLSQFFLKFKHIKIEDFFEAPIILHPDEKYPLLNFFTTRKAIKLYKNLLSVRENESPDKQLNFIKNGLIYITKFCLEKNIPWSDYLSYKEEYMPLWIEHYKNQNINIYSLLMCDNLHYIQNIPQEDLDIWLPGFLNKLFACKNRLHQNFKIKQTLTVAVESLKKFILTEQLKNHN